MKLLTELLRLRRLDGEEPHDDKFQDDGQGATRDTETEPRDPAQRDPAEKTNDDEFADFDDIEGDTEDQAKPVDPDRAGVLRNVKGAHLVYKREQPDGTYEEMWIYNSGAFKRDLETKKAIVSGTDIPPNATQSPDGSQTLKMWSAGNADVIVISGLPQ